MIIRWSRLAERDLAGIESHIMRNSPAAARRMVAHIIGLIDDLADFPDSGRIGSVKGTREKLALPFPYVIVYESLSTRKEIWIARIYHMAQDR